MIKFEKTNTERLKKDIRRSSGNSVPGTVLAQRSKQLNFFERFELFIPLSDEALGSHLPSEKTF
jgi:hypothetical protein